MIKTFEKFKLFRKKEKLNPLPLPPINPLDPYGEDNWNEPDIKKAKRYGSLTSQDIDDIAREDGYPSTEEYMKMLKKDGIISDSEYTYWAMENGIY